MHLHLIKTYKSTLDLRSQATFTTTSCLYHDPSIRSMPEYVYALHDFLPENEDEVAFHAGERVEVIEKDDMYGDGWWHVCVLVLHLFRLD